MPTTRPTSRGPTVRLLPAEVLLDAISQVLDMPEPVPGARPAACAVQLPGVAAEGEFLKVFGKPERLLTCECERSESTTLAQAFQMINGQSVLRKLEAADNRIGGLLERHSARRRRSSTTCTSPPSAARRPRPSARRSWPASVARAHDLATPGKTSPGPF